VTRRAPAPQRGPRELPRARRPPHGAAALVDAGGEPQVQENFYPAWSRTGTAAPTRYTRGLRRRVLVELPGPVGGDATVPACRRHARQPVATTSQSGVR
jgi:hypothetical protein